MFYGVHSIAVDSKGNIYTTENVSRAARAAVPLQGTLGCGEDGFKESSGLKNSGTTEDDRRNLKLRSSPAFRSRDPRV
jgi:hypothetical protein